MSPWTAAAIGLGAGTFVGWLALRSAEKDLARAFLTGGEDLSRELDAGTATALTKVPSAIRHEVQTETEKELRNLGLDAGDVRQWIAITEGARQWL